MVFGETLRLSSFPRCHELLTQRLRHSAELKSTHTQFVDDTHAAEVALFLSIAPFGVCVFGHSASRGLTVPKQKSKVKHYSAVLTLFPENLRCLVISDTQFLFTSVKPRLLLCVVSLTAVTTPDSGNKKFDSG